MARWRSRRSDAELAVELLEPFGDLDHAATTVFLVAFFQDQATSEFAHDLREGLRESNLELLMSDDEVRWQIAACSVCVAARRFFDREDPLVLPSVAQAVASVLSNASGRWPDPFSLEPAEAALQLLVRIWPWTAVLSVGVLLLLEAHSEEVWFRWLALFTWVVAINQSGRLWWRSRRAD